MYELHSDIDIAGTPQDVWSVLVDFPAHSGWNPFIREIYGTAREGTSLKICVRPPGAPRVRLRGTVLAARPPQELRWRTRMLISGVFGAEHWFVLIPLSDREVRLHQSLRINGLISPFLRNRVDRNIYRGFREMNSALKGRVERSQQRTDPQPSQGDNVATLESVLFPNSAPSVAVEESSAEPEEMRRGVR